MSTGSPSDMDESGQCIERPQFRTHVDYLRARSRRYGQFTQLVVYDPMNRGSEFVEQLLGGHGLHVDIDDEGPEVALETGRPPA